MSRRPTEAAPTWDELREASAIEHAARVAADPSSSPEVAEQARRSLRSWALVAECRQCARRGGDLPRGLSLSSLAKLRWALESADDDIPQEWRLIGPPGLPEPQ